MVESIGEVVMEMLQSSYIQFLIIAAFLTAVLIFIKYFKMRSAVDQIRNKLLQMEKEHEAEKVFLFSTWLENEKQIPAIVKGAWFRYTTEYRKTGKLPDTFEHFYEDLLVSKYGNRKLVEAVPAIFLSLGILGTFYGITVGVQSIDQSTLAGNIESGISSLISGMQIAFHSSIAGIILSLILQLLDRTVFYKMLVNSANQLKNDLDEAFPLVTEGHLLNKMLKQQETQNRDLQNVLQKGFSQMGAQLDELVREALLPSFQENQESMKLQIKEMRSIKNMFDQEFIPKMMTRFSEIYNDNVKPMLTEANELQYKSAVTVEQLNDYLTKNWLPDYINGLQGVLREEVHPYFKTNQLYQKNMENYLKEELPNKIVKPLQTQLHTNQNNIDNHMNELNRIQIQQLETSQNHNEELNQKMYNAITLPITEKLQQKQEIHQQYINDTIIYKFEQNEEKMVSQENELKNINSVLEYKLIPQLNSQLENLYVKVDEGNEQLNYMSEQTVNDFRGGLEQIVDHVIHEIYSMSKNQLQNVSDVMERTQHWQEKVFEELDQLVQNLGLSSKQQLELSDRVHQLTDNLVGYSDKLQHFSNHLNQFTDTVIEKQERLSSSAQHLLTVSNKNEQVAHSLGELLRSVTRERAAFDEQLSTKMKDYLKVMSLVKSQGESLKGIQDRMDEFHQKFAVTTERVNELTVSNQSLAESLDKESQRSTEMVSYLNRHMEESIRNYQQLQKLQLKSGEYLESLINERMRMDKLKDEEYQLLINQLNQFDERMNQLISFWRKNAEGLRSSQVQFVKLGEKLDLTIEQMETGLNRSFDQFGKQLSSYVTTRPQIKGPKDK